jgi:hypothetical protein
MNDITLPAYGIVIIFFFLLYPYIKNTPQNVRSQKFPKISNTPQNVRFQQFLIFDSSLIVFFLLCVLLYFTILICFYPKKLTVHFFSFFSYFTSLLLQPLWSTFAAISGGPFRLCCPFFISPLLKKREEWTSF